MNRGFEPSARPRIVHVIDRLNLGGMESIVLTVIEATRDAYEHVIIGLRDRGELAPRAEALGISVETIHKQPGKDPAAYLRLRQRLRSLAPAIVHTYNIGAIDAGAVARLAGCRRVIHAEHGRDAADPNGSNRKYRWLRRLLAPAISRFVPVSADLERWLIDDIRIPSARVHLIRNGIDVDRFAPGAKEPVAGLSHIPVASRIIGTVGRLDPVKGFDGLLEAMALVVAGQNSAPVHLVIVGDGPERDRLAKRIDELGLAKHVTLAGQRDDADKLLRAFDMYVCSSIAEGIALTVLEAMASARPVVATEVGGNPELVEPETTGVLVPPRDAQALADALMRLLDDPDAAARMGAAGRDRAVERFSVNAMVDGYRNLYDALLAR
ncbi:glycosyltransferase [Salinisphaera sp. SPP-AMP-43]|uniref:glycosyltransferase n=1 Tax=Salinisphaera sp. SPP-AMP-43 TaxID=3121288 RepID=UPI003C6E21DB